jgi:nucleoid-associated protein YgaU
MDAFGLSRRGLGAATHLVTGLAIGALVQGCAGAGVKPDTPEVVVQAEAVDGSNDVVAELVKLAKQRQAKAKETGTNPAPVGGPGAVAEGGQAAAEGPVGLIGGPSAPDAVQGIERSPAGEVGSEKKTPKSAQKRKKGASIAYVVKPGDTLMKIAFEVFGDLRRWREIHALNRESVRNPSLLAPGLKLKIFLSDYVVVVKNGKPYLIRRGDTLVGISRGLYGTPMKWKKLWYNNRQLIHDPNKIYAGFHLYYEMSEADRREADRLLGRAAPASSPEPVIPLAPPQRDVASVAGSEKK